MLVHDAGEISPRRGDPPEGARPVAVHVQDVRLAPIEFPQERWQRPRIELRSIHGRDRDSQRLEGVWGGVWLAQADQRHVEQRLIEARDHPGEQPLYTVNARPCPTQVIADLNDVQAAAHSIPRSRYHAAVRLTPPSRSTAAANPSSRRARDVSNARLFR